VRELEKKFSGKVSSDKSAAFVSWACKRWILFRIEMNFRLCMIVLWSNFWKSDYIWSILCIIVVLECPSLLTCLSSRNWDLFVFSIVKDIIWFAGCSADCNKAYFEGSKERNSS
jgi:hypothetical protein